MAKLNDELTLFKSGYIASDIAECFPYESLDGKGKPNRLASKVKNILNFTTFSAKVHKIPTEPRLAEFVDKSVSDQELDGFDPFEAIPPRKENYAFRVEVTPSPPRRKLAGQAENDVKYISIREIERSHHISEPLAFNPFVVTQTSIEFESSSAVMPSHFQNSRLQQDIDRTTSTCSDSNTALNSYQEFDPLLLVDTTEESTVFWAYSAEETPLLLDFSLEQSTNTNFPSRRDFETTPNTSYLEFDPPLELFDSPLQHRTSNITSISDLRPLQLYNTPSSPMPVLQDLISQIDAASVNISVKNIFDECCEVAEIKISSCPTMLEGIAPQEQLSDFSLEQSTNTNFPSRRDFDRTPDTSYLELDPPLELFDSPVEQGANNITSMSDLRPLQLYNTPSSPMPLLQTNLNVSSQIEAASVDISVKNRSDESCKVAEMKTTSGCAASLEGVDPQEQLRVRDHNARRVFLLLCCTEGDEGFEVTPVSEITCSFPMVGMRKNMVSESNGDDTPKISNCTAI